MGSRKCQCYAPFFQGYAKPVPVYAWTPAPRGGAICLFCGKKLPVWCWPKLEPEATDDDRPARPEIAR